MFFKAVRKLLIDNILIFFRENEISRPDVNQNSQKSIILLQNQRIYYRKPYRKPREIPDFPKSEGFTLTTNTLDGDYSKKKSANDS